MIAGQKMLMDMKQKRLELYEAAGQESLDSEFYGKGFKIKAKDLIMMTVPEKQNFLTKR